MDSSETDPYFQTSFPRGLTSEERQVLDYLYLCHRKGPGPHSIDIRWRRVILFLSACVAICAGWVAFGNLIPPILSTMVMGFIVGVLFMVTRRQMTFERDWPLLDLIIDWKLVEQVRNQPEAIADQVPNSSL